MATIAAPEHAQPQALTAASWRALIASFLGWMFDGYETYALILVAGVALRQLLLPDQLASIPIYIGGLLAVTLVGWATGGIIAGVLADYIGRKRMLMLSILWYALFTGLTAFAGSYTSLLILRFLTGLGLGAEWGPGTAILGESWPARSRGRAASVLQSAIGFGLLLASGVWLFVAPLGPDAWRYMFLLGVLPALSVLWIRRSVRDPDLWIAVSERRRQARQRLASGELASREDRLLVGFTVFGGGCSFCSPCRSPRSWRGGRCRRGFRSTQGSSRLGPAAMRCAGPPWPGSTTTSAASSAISSSACSPTSGAASPRCCSTTQAQSFSSSCCFAPWRTLPSFSSWLP